jgi:hypothetical protein
MDSSVLVIKVVGIQKTCLSTISIVGTNQGYVKRISLVHANSRDSRTLFIESEKSDCITIMASNRVIEMDPALDRRITMKVPFFLPDEKQREKIWKALVPPNVSLG